MDGISYDALTTMSQNEMIGHRIGIYMRHKRRNGCMSVPKNGFNRLKLAGRI